MKTQPSFQHRSPTGHGPLRVAWGLLLAAACVVLFGCGRGGPEVVKVTGKVTFGGGVWPAEGTLYFTPVEPAEGMPARPAPAKNNHFFRKNPPKSGKKRASPKKRPYPPPVGVRPAG